MNGIKPLIALLLVAMVIGGISWLAVRSLGGPDEVESATVLPERQPLPEFSLLDHDGAPFTREHLVGRTSLLFFGFTHCPDICPATLEQLSRARRELASGGTPESRLPQIVLVSVDPERDTPERLAAYVGHFGPGIVGVTGSEAEIRVLAEPLGVWFEKQPMGDGYSVSHSTAVLVVDPQARLQALFATPHRAESFVHDIPLLMASR